MDRLRKRTRTEGDWDREQAARDADRQSFLDEARELFPYESEFEIWEALENFRACLALLEEWDERERRNARGELDRNPEHAVESGEEETTP